MLNEMSQIPTQSGKSRNAGKKFAVLLLVLLLMTNFSVAQKNNEQVNINSFAKKNLIMALNSDNIGLKRSAAYFAGYYKVQEAVESLTDLLNSSSNDVSLKTLAAYSLYQIGDDGSLDALKNAANHNKNKRLCSKCKLMYEDLMQVKPGIAYQ